MISLYVPVYIYGFTVLIALHSLFYIAHDGCSLAYAFGTTGLTFTEEIYVFEKVLGRHHNTVDKCDISVTQIDMDIYDVTCHLYPQI